MTERLQPNFPLDILQRKDDWILKGKSLMDVWPKVICLQKTCLLWMALVVPALGDPPKLLDDQFELPTGFHVYRAAQAELTGGSYDLAFDGQGRLLVGEGNAVRRLLDQDHDGTYDAFETIAEGPPVRGRGPQGLLVYGDFLYAVGGDGVQLYRGYSGAGKLTHERRLGSPFSTGGDHTAHTVLRGLDGYVYLVTGDGAGAGGRAHITESGSPVLEERAASVFRFDPQGEKWECIGSGGRNPPSLGMNYLGELFSFDSDMEFHVDVPFYRPVRLNHWATGGDQGWQSVGAFPSYYVDCLPGVLDVGRGSPNWGVFYEHYQLPGRYHDTFLVCDYRWKSATTGQLATSGRLVAFHLTRDGASWKAEMSELVRARPEAHDANGQAINFALVDIDIAPDGSLFVTDHNQGIWRIFYDPSTTPEIPPIVPEQDNPVGEDQLFAALLELPQPASEWSRLQEENLKQRITPNVWSELEKAALDPELTLRKRLRAIRLLSPSFKELNKAFVRQLSQQSAAEVRGQAAWLVGIRGKAEEIDLAIRLLRDDDPFVRRRAAEALTRLGSSTANAPLIESLGDADRFVRYAAMLAIAHRPTDTIFAMASPQMRTQVLVRLLVAAHLRKERPDAVAAVEMISRLLESNRQGIEDELDLLRVLSLYRPEVESSAGLRRSVESHLLMSRENVSRPLRWEQIRLLGEYKVAAGFSFLVDQLVQEKDYVTQFHIATALAEIPQPVAGWPTKARQRLAEWLLSTQTGWFADFAGKGLQFPSFWATVLNKLGDQHADVLAAHVGKLNPNSQLTEVVFSKVDEVPNADTILSDLYRAASEVSTKQNILHLLTLVRTPKAAMFLKAQLATTEDIELRKSLLIALGPQAELIDRPEIFLRGLFEYDEMAVISACLDGLLRSEKSLQEIAAVNELATGDYRGKRAVYFRVLELMERSEGHVSQLEQVMSLFSGRQPPSSHVGPRVIWSSNKQEDQDKAWFAKSFALEEKPILSELIITCDNEFTAYLNGKEIAQGNDWVRPLRINLQGKLRRGKNLIAIAAQNLGGPAGLIASLSWTTETGVRDQVATNSRWHVSTGPPANWQAMGTRQGRWRRSVDVTGPTVNVLQVYNEFTKTNPGNLTLTMQEFWHKWYLEQYGEAFVGRSLSQATQRPDQVIHQLLAEMKEVNGNVERGRALYLKTGCYACHGGVGNKRTTIFGPSLAGATLRLKRQELADAIVFPSKQVVERFKASVLETADGKLLSGFITELSEDFVSITDLQNKVTRLPRDEVESIEVQDKSLMPPKLLNALSDDEIRDLIAFLQVLK